MHAVGALWQKDGQMDLETLSAATMMLDLEIPPPMKMEVPLSVSNQIGQCVFPLQFQKDAKVQKIQCLSCTYQPALQYDNEVDLSTFWTHWHFSGQKKRWEQKYENKRAPFHQSLAILVQSQVQCKSRCQLDLFYQQKVLLYQQENLDPDPTAPTLRTWLKQNK